MSSKQTSQTGVKAKVGNAQVQVLRNNPELLRKAIGSEITRLSKLTNQKGDVAARANRRLKQLNGLMKSDMQLTQGTIRLLGSQLITEAASLAGGKIAADAEVSKTKALAGVESERQKAIAASYQANHQSTPTASVADLINGSAGGTSDERDDDGRDLSDFYGYSGR